MSSVDLDEGFDKGINSLAGRPVSIRSAIETYVAAGAVFAYGRPITDSPHDFNGVGLGVKKTLPRRSQRPVKPGFAIPPLAYPTSGGFKIRAVVVSMTGSIFRP